MAQTVTKNKLNSPKQKGIAKTPMVMQLEATECGAASLTMVLAYYGKWISLEQARKDCGVSRDGSNAKNILRAARNYGLNAKGYRYEPENLKREGSFPCIVHWEFNHFIVVNGFRGGKVYVSDPARGSYAMTEEEFDEGFTGVVLFFSPGEGFERGGKPKSVSSFAKKRMNGLGTGVTFVAIVMGISALFGIFTPAFDRVFVDRLLSGKNPEWLMPFLWGVGIFSVLWVIISWIGAVYTLRIHGKIATVSNTSYMWKVLRKPMEFFSQRMAGDIQQRKDTNETIVATLVDTLAPLLLHTGMMIFYLVVMLRYSLPLTVIGVCSVAVNMILGQILAKKRINITRVMMRDEGNLYSATVSGIEMIETIKSSGAENGFFQKWAGYQANVNAGRNQFEKVSVMFELFTRLITTLTDAVVLVLGIYLVMKGQFSLGCIMAFQGFLESFSQPAQELITAGQTLQEMRTDMERVEDVMDYPEDPAFAGEEEDSVLPDMGSDFAGGYDKLLGNIELRNITFGYSPLAEPLLSDFSLTIAAGSRIAIVGASGCGKSTISKIVSGLYEPWRGEILFDGRPRSEIDRNVITGSLAVVDQEIILFEDTIANNIRMWDTSIEDFEVIMAARDAKLHEDIMQRAGGYDYRMLEGGKDFSGGQRQRLEIARVLAQDPTILILDEATSALDAKTESEVVASIKDRGITCIVVAHRLSTIRDCDEILVLDHGTIVERGTHEELMALGGYYTALVTSE